MFFLRIVNVFAFFSGYFRRGVLHMCRHVRSTGAGVVLVMERCSDFDLSVLILHAEMDLAQRAATIFSLAVSSSFLSDSRASSSSLIGLRYNSTRIGKWSDPMPGRRSILHTLKWPEQKM